MLVRLCQKVNEQINYFSNIQRDYFESIHLFFSNIFGTYIVKQWRSQDLI